MNWNQIEGNWKQFKGLAKVRWGQFTDSRMGVAAGKRDGKAGAVQEVYGNAQEADNRKIGDRQKAPPPKKDLRDLQ